MFVTHCNPLLQDPSSPYIHVCHTNPLLQDPSSPYIHVCHTVILSLLTSQMDLLTQPYMLSRTSHLLYQPPLSFPLTSHITLAISATTTIPINISTFRIWPEKITHGSIMRHFLLAVDGANLIKGLYGWWEATMYTEYLHNKTNMYTHLHKTTMYTQYLHYTTTMYTQYLHNMTTMYTQYLHNKTTMYTQYLHETTMYIQYLHKTNMYTQYLHYKTTTYTQYLLYKTTMYTQYLHNTTTMYTQYLHKSS